MARKNKVQVSETAVSATLPVVASQDVILPSVSETANLTLANDVKTVVLTAEDFSESRTKITQAKPWDCYVVRSSGGSKSSHQIKASGYAESCNPFLPSRELYESTGNPYPADINAPGNVVSAPKYNHYRAFAVMAHVIFNRLRTSDNAVSAESLYFDSDVVEETGRLIGKPVNKPAAAEDNYVLNAIICTLRELELCGGFLMALSSKRDRKSMFKPVNALLSK
jgi:hypothetical protein